MLPSGGLDNFGSTPTEFSVGPETLRRNTMTIPQTLDHTTVRTHRITGAGGVRLCVEETGNPSGRPVLFVHGLSQCRLAWNHQLHSDLTRDLRLVALDLRGHGDSDRPADAYGDSAAWAQDLHEVITALELRRPILTGWSYGGVVIGDYLSRYGEGAIGGVHLVGAVSRLGEPAMPFLGPRFLAAVPGLFSADAEESMTALQEFVRLLTFDRLDPEDTYLLLGAAAAVSPGVRQKLLSRSLEHDGVLAGLSAPVLITHGLEDEIVLPAMAEHHASLIPHAQTSYYPRIGHGTFWEDPSRFNSELRAFAASV
jgi:non-heme chloroperoxidase